MIKKNTGRGSEGRRVRIIDPASLFESIRQHDDRAIIDPNATKHIKHARGRLIAPFDHGGRPYLASAVMALRLVKRPNYGTLGVDQYWRLYYDPDEIIYWPVSALAAVIEHEVWHLLRQHHIRAREAGLDPKTTPDSEFVRWNVAADCEIHSNEQLLEEMRQIPFSDPDDDFMYPARFGLPPKMLAEWYYEHLPSFSPPEEYDEEEMVLPYESYEQAQRIGMDDWEDWSYEHGRDWGSGKPPFKTNIGFVPPAPGGPPGGGGGGNGDGPPGDNGNGGRRRRRRDPEDWFEYVDPTRGVGGACADGRPRDLDLPPDDEVINRAEEAEIRRRIARAVQGAKTRGAGGPGGWVGEWADAELAAPKEDWRDVLHAVIQRAIDVTRGNLQFTSRRLSRRQIASPDVLLYGMEAPVPRVAVVLDTSGSMFSAAYSPESAAQAEEGFEYSTLLHEALVEIDGILEALGNTVAVAILATDMAVQAAEEVYAIEDITLLGGGGTDMSVGLYAAELLEPPPHIIICLTDGYTPWPKEHPGFDATYIVGIVGSTEQELARTWPPPEWADEIIFIDEVHDDE